MSNREQPAGDSRDWNTLERVIGVKFKDRSLLRQATVHRSLLNEQPNSGLESYERLEYLGDAFLGWVVAGELFRRYPEFGEGKLTRARAALVQGRTLAEIARTLELGAYLSMGQGEEASGGRGRQSILAAALEALLGAVLLDRNEATARKLVFRWLGDRVAHLDTGGVARDAKSALQELVQARGLPLPQYELLEAAGPAHDRRFTVRVLIDGKPCGAGTGGRKSDAEQAAAAEAIAALTEGLPGSSASD